MLLQADFQDGVEALHVFGELRATGIGESSHSQHGLFMNGGMPIAEDREESLHDLVCILQHCDFRGLLLCQLLNDDLQDATQQPLQRRDGTFWNFAD